MTRRRLGVALGAIVAFAIGISCGEVPTVPLGIAYITPIITPSPTVAVGDTLRDSAGKVAPLQVFAIGRSDTDTIRNIALRFLITSLGSRATIDANGFLVVPDSLQTLRLVAQVTDPAGGDALQLQTPEFTIDVVPLADTIARTTPRDTLVLPVTHLSVTVSGVGPTARGTVAGIRVRYRIAQVFPGTVPTTGRYYLADADGRVLRPDSTIAIDTTSSGGVAERDLISLLAPAGQANADSVLVEASASSQRGIALKGSPVRFFVRIKKS